MFDILWSFEALVFLGCLPWYLVSWGIWLSLKQVQSLPSISSDGDRINPRLSVIIAARNEAETIENALKSVLAQNYPNLEIILVNDRSNDGTDKILQKLAEKDPKIKGGKMYVRGPSGEIIEVPWTGKQTPINYNESGYFRFQPSNFVPGYEDSVYLSRLTGYSTTKPVENTASQMGGFCDYHKHSPIKKEEACSKLDKNACASTNCCVLLGGSRCVGGNEKGPNMKAHYGDITILNKDFYYYQGKCYGNCSH